MALREGQIVDDCSFIRLNGKRVRLWEFDNPALIVIFLRHLASISCRAHLWDVQKEYPLIRQLGGQVLVVCCAPLEILSSYVARHPLLLPIVTDPTREAYRNFQLGQTSWVRVLGMRALLSYAQLVLNGWLPQKSQGEGLYQLGGDFVLDGRRRLVHAYYSKYPTVRPSAHELVEAVRTTV